MTRDCIECGDPFTPVKYAREKCASCMKYEKSVSGVQMAQDADIPAVVKRIKQRWPNTPFMLVLLDAVPDMDELIDISDADLYDALIEHVLTTS